MKTCKLKGCRGDHYALGWCQRHYEQDRLGQEVTLERRKPGPAPKPNSARQQVLAALSAVPTGLSRRDLMKAVTGSAGYAIKSLEDESRIERLIEGGYVFYRLKSNG